MRRRAQHVDVCAGAEDPRLQAGNYHDAHFRMFKTDSLDRVSQFNVHAEVIGIEFELVAFGDRLVFLHVHREFRDGPGYGKLPVFVLIRRCLKINH